MFLVLVITMFCSISITVAASRTTWAMARDDAMPLSKLWSKVSHTHGVPMWSLVLVTVIQMLLGLINLGSSSAFYAFVSVGVIALAVSYAIPIGTSMWYRREEVVKARWKLPYGVGWVVNTIAVLWISFECVLFSMPTALPVTVAAMNYASVVLVGFMTLAAIWYGVHARKGRSNSPHAQDKS